MQGWVMFPVMTQVSWIENWSCSGTLPYNHTVTMTTCSSLTQPITNLPSYFQKIQKKVTDKWQRQIKLTNNGIFWLQSFLYIFTVMLEAFRICPAVYQCVVKILVQPFIDLPYYFRYFFSKSRVGYDLIKLLASSSVIGMTNFMWCLKLVLLQCREQRICKNFSFKKTCVS